MNQNVCNSGTKEKNYIMFKVIITLKFIAIVILFQITFRLDNSLNVSKWTRL